MVGTYGKEFQLFKGDDNPLHDIFIVDTNSPTETISVAKKLKSYNMYMIHAMVELQLRSYLGQWQRSSVGA